MEAYTHDLEVSGRFDDYCLRLLERDRRRHREAMAKRVRPPPGTLP